MTHFTSPPPPPATPPLYSTPSTIHPKPSYLSEPPLRPHSTTPQPPLHPFHNPSQAISTLCTTSMIHSTSPQPTQSPLHLTTPLPLFISSHHNSPYHLYDPTPPLHNPYQPLLHLTPPLPQSFLSLSTLYHPLDPFHLSTTHPNHPSTLLLLFHNLSQASQPFVSPIRLPLHLSTTNPNHSIPSP